MDCRLHHGSTARGSERETSMDFEGISPELLEKARTCQTPEEIFKLAEEAGVDLSEQQLEAIAGGGSWGCDYEPCPEAWHA